MAGVVFLDSMAEITGYAGVERIVFTFDDVDIPGHVGTPRKLGSV